MKTKQNKVLPSSDKGFCRCHTQQGCMTYACSGVCVVLM